MKIKFAKLNQEAVIPTYAKDDDACLDLTAISMEYNSETNTYDYDFGLSVEIPSGHVGLLFSRSSVAKTDLILANGTGVIDAGYRGRLGAKYRTSVVNPKTWQVGQRIAQLMVIPIPKLEVVEEDHGNLSKTQRGTGGWGSSGS